MKRTNITLRIHHWASKADKAMETMILHCPWDWYAAQKAYEYARVVLKKRWREGEGKILNNPHYAYMYARHVIQGRWPEAEKIIASRSDSGYLYAKYVVKGRFEEVEKNKNWELRDFYLYCKYVLKARWKSLENKVFKKDKYFHNPEHLVKYARDFIEGRWEKAEDFIVKSRYIGQYAAFLKEEDKELFHNKVLAESLVDNGKCYYYYNHAQEYIKNLKTKPVSDIV
jgi:hypothetical protein